MLISSIQEIQTIIPVGVANDYKRLQPHIENAETAFIKPLIGNDMYDELAEFYESYPYEDMTSIQEATEVLLKKIQHAIVHLAYYVGFDFLNTSVTDMGFTRTESQTSKTLFKYQEDALREYFKTSGFNILDEVLIYLEENIDYFSEFELNDAYTVFKKAFIPTATVYHQIIHINNSRITFLRLQQHIKFVEETIIKPVLGATIYDEIKEGMIDVPVPTKVVNVLPFIRTPIAFFSAARLMEETAAELTERGLYFTATIPLGVDSRKNAPATAERIALLVARARNDGNAYLEMLKTYMTDNLSDWTDYTTVQGSVLNRDNTDKKTFWV